MAVKLRGGGKKSGVYGQNPLFPRNPEKGAGCINPKSKAPIAMYVESIKSVPEIRGWETIFVTQPSNLKSKLCDQNWSFFNGV